MFPSANRYLHHRHRHAQSRLKIQSKETFFLVLKESSLGKLLCVATQHGFGSILSSPLSNRILENRWGEGEDEERWRKGIIVIRFLPQQSGGIASGTKCGRSHSK